jgi:hypothetical protein
MTYKNLLSILQTLNEEQLNQTVTVFEPYEDEFIAVISADYAKEETNDVLDPEHLYLVMKA